MCEKKREEGTSPVVAKSNLPLLLLLSLLDAKRAGNGGRSGGRGFRDPLTGLAIGGRDAKEERRGVNQATAADRQKDRESMPEIGRRKSFETVGPLGKGEGAFMDVENTHRAIYSFFAFRVMSAHVVSTNPPLRLTSLFDVRKRKFHSDCC